MEVFRILNLVVYHLWGDIYILASCDTQVRVLLSFFDSPTLYYFNGVRIKEGCWSNFPLIQLINCCLLDLFKTSNFVMLRLLKHNWRLKINIQVVFHFPLVRHRANVEKLFDIVQNPSFVKVLHLVKSSV